MKKIIFITGASSGMGLQTTKDLVAQGYIVYGGARRVEPIKKVGAHAIKLDMTDKKSLQKAVDKIIAEQGRIDILWNNAGYGLYGPVEQIPIEQARQQFEVNVFGLAELTQMVLPHMRKQKSGLIINTSSMGGKMYTPLGAWYHATKHAIEGFSDCLRLELAELGIKVVILEPGLIATSFGEVVGSQIDPEWKKGPYKHIVNPLLLAFEKGDSFSNASPSSLISKTIQQIIESKNPKTRYLIGNMAKPAVFMRNLLGDKKFDKIIMKQFS